MLLYSHLTNDELLKEVYAVFPPTPLMMELAFRLENEYPNDLAVGVDEYFKPIHELSLRSDSFLLH